jgi:glyoxylase-like metal-dependent hydrolase (beta-lactamase superfamily II)
MLEMIDPSIQDVNWLPGIQLRFVYGHTEAMMLPIIDTPSGRIMYCADLLPSRWHVRMPYVMAYDIRPLETLREKERLLNEAADAAFTLYLEHDPERAYCQVERDAQGNIGVKEQ